MKTIWKFQLPPHPGLGVWIAVVEMPENARPLSAALQEAPVAGLPQNCLPSWPAPTRITIWAEVDAAHRALELRHIAVIGTGWAYHEAGAFLGTIFDGPFVWHVFDLGPVFQPPHATDEAERAADAVAPGEEK